MIATLFSIANCTIYLIGIIATIKVIFILFNALKAVTTRLNASWGEKYGAGSWAVVTGCT